MLDALQRLAPAVLRHLIAYGDLLSEETGDALRLSRRRALGIAVTVAAGLMALALACVLAIAASWDGPNRLLVVSLLCLSFIIVALIGAAYARGGNLGGRAPPFGRLRTEWKADLQQLAQLYPSLGIAPNPPISPGSTVHVN